jgi:hypothetical protein
MHGLSIEHAGVRYGITVQRYALKSVYHFFRIWDPTHQRWLPIDDIEREYIRRQGSTPAPIRSIRAARRRARQYLRVWTDLQAHDSATG